MPIHCIWIIWAGPRYRRPRQRAMQILPERRLGIFRMVACVLACLLLVASPAAAQDEGGPAALVSQPERGAPWWIVPVFGGGCAFIGFGAGATIGLAAYADGCESCWGGGDAWLTGGVIGAGIGAGVGIITSTIIVLATNSSKRPTATPVIVASPEHAYAGVSVAF